MSDGKTVGQEKVIYDDVVIDENADWVGDMTLDQVKAHIAEKGYDGLMNFEAGCACRASNIDECAKPEPKCLFGYLIDCPLGQPNGEFCIGGDKGIRCTPDENGEYGCGRSVDKAEQ